VFYLDIQKEGTKTLNAAGFSVKITTRLTRKVDSDLVQEIAAEHGLELYLPSLFRWRPEINATNWKGAMSDVTDKLSKAITTTAGRPSYSISAINKEETWPTTSTKQSPPRRAARRIPSAP